MLLGLMVEVFMPELPEVETIVRGLREQLLNLRFSKVEVELKKCLKDSPKNFTSSLEDRKILNVERRGKNIILRLSRGAALLIHLRMTGRLRLVPALTPPEKHTHVIFSFKNHPYQLRFVDQRQFGRLCLETNQAGGELDALADLGPEPFEIPAKEFVRITRLKHRAIKPLLLDQRFLAGVGNIYADEALHQAGINPRQQAFSLEEKNLLMLYHSLKRILKKAIDAGGSSVRTYVNASGSTGSFQKYLRVYGRKGKDCKTCGLSIVRDRVGGRSSFYCPCCQALRPG
ncbi:MAG: bifunctional DNA-formamidopyrimidine glycosylase/DNA-(apurinic or apyrimidinic site) lyase [Deltaproteobacteria bacterium]|nr:bifunctional DNA-formamidopyrimidine glycosylase/DNA-(apurinic or apyrimidinic site) lyase [Deltaproteobacteria bacterium]